MTERARSCSCGFGEEWLVGLWFAAASRSRATLQELDILPGVKEALQKAGAQKLIASSSPTSPTLPGGTLARESGRSHARTQLRSELEIDDVLVCWHDDATDVRAASPKPGLLWKGPSGTAWICQSFMVGDTGGGTWRPARRARVSYCLD